MFSILFRTILTVHFYKNISLSVEILMFPVKLVLQEVFAEKPHTVYAADSCSDIVTKRC